MSNDEFGLAPRRRRRITMTKAQATSAVGQSIVAAIISITEDGEITEQEARDLRALLDELDGTDVPAVDYLFDAIDDVLSDGKFDHADAWEMRCAFERVLPAPLRKRVFQEFDKAGAARARRSTSPQRAYLETLGVMISVDTTLEEAAALIDRAHEERPLPVSNRQLMVLRFWDRLAVASRGRRGVTRWMCGWYMDPRRKRAWELYKVESGDDGAQSDPESVPIGLGYKYLDRLQEEFTSALADAFAADAIPRSDEDAVRAGGVSLDGAVTATADAFAEALRSTEKK